MNEGWANLTSAREYLAFRLGPQQLSSPVLIPLTIVYVTIFVSGIVGNASVCVVIVRHPSMQTTTNLYLFSLAVSDLLLLLFGLPNDLQLFWQQYPWTFGDTLCKGRALVSEAANYASVLTIVAFTVERYVAVCHPILSQTLSNLRRVFRVIIATWVISCVSAVPFAIFTRVDYIDYPPGSGVWLEESALCGIRSIDGYHYRPLLLASSLIFFLLPMTLIIALYVRIAIVLKTTHAGHTNDEEKRKNICRLLIAVVFAFFVCWAPFHAQRLLFVYDDVHNWPSSLLKLNEILYFAGCLYYLNCTINPVLYNVMSVKYRDAFRDTLCGFFGSKTRQQSVRKTVCTSKQNGAPDVTVGVNDVKECIFSPDAARPSFDAEVDLGLLRETSV